MKKKKCSKCKEPKPLKEFHKNKTKKFGVASACRQCELERSKEYRAKIPEKLYNRNLAYKNANPEKVREQQRKVNQRHKYQLTDSYVANKYLRKRLAECTPDEIEQARATVLKHRNKKKVL